MYGPGQYAGAPGGMSFDLMNFCCECTNIIFFFFSQVQFHNRNRNLIRNRNQHRLVVDWEADQHLQHLLHHLLQVQAETITMVNNFCYQFVINVFELESLNLNKN